MEWSELELDLLIFAVRYVLSKNRDNLLTDEYISLLKKLREFKELEVE